MDNAGLKRHAARRVLRERGYAMPHSPRMRASAESGMCSAFLSSPT
jgi:hypothetical protein